MASLEGRSLGRYHILEQLGEGGMAVVYKAFDTRLERNVAVKIIRREAFSPEILDRVLQRFEREAKALARMSHPNIVKVYDYGEHDGAPYLVMELVSGGTLKRQSGKPMPWQKAVRLLQPIVGALGYAHDRKIIHRDIKPSNILVTDSGEPLLTDFGIAKILELGEGATLTGSGVGIGTPEYMAPEQGVGNEIDGRVDVYALGVVLYELVTGHRPFEADTPMAVVIKHITEPLPRPIQYIPNLPDAVENVLVKALAKEPEERYENMSAFEAALEKLVRGLEDMSDEVVGLEPAVVLDQPKDDEETHKRLGTGIARLERVIAESLAAEDVEGAEALVATMERMGTLGQEAATRLKIEITRVRERIDGRQQTSGQARLPATAKDDAVSRPAFGGPQGVLHRPRWLSAPVILLVIVGVVVLTIICLAVLNVFAPPALYGERSIVSTPTDIPSLQYFTGLWEQEDNDAYAQANGSLRPWQEYFAYHDDPDDYFSVYVPFDGLITVDMSTEHLTTGPDGQDVVQLLMYYQSADYLVVQAEPSDNVFIIEINGLAGWYYIRVFTDPEYLDETEIYKLMVTYP